MDSLRAALAPESVAVIGASENPNKIGGRPLHYLSRFGFKGRVYPINPNRQEVQGFKAFADMASLPEAPEAAVVAVPGEAAVEALEACVARGVKLVVMMASGFGELGAEGKARERRMVERARAGGTRIIGPNTQGIANFGTGAVLNFSTMFMEAPPQDGPVGIVSQSGAISVVPYGLLRLAGIGVRHVHATGNDSDVTAGEMAAAVAADPDVKLLLLYLEGIRAPGPFAEMARIALERDLPVIALKSGRTAAGQNAARSHTGALANEDRVVDAFFERHGIWRVPDTTSLVKAAELYLKGWRPEGRRLVTISNSGAIGVLASDSATDLGMPMAALGEETKAKLRAVLPSFAPIGNPVDTTAALLSNNRLFGEILPILADDPAADVFMVAIPAAGRGYDIDAFARDTGAFAAKTGKPVVLAAPQALISDRFKAEGIPVFPGEGEAIAALHQFVSHLARMRRARRRPGLGEAGAPAAAGAAAMLNEAESLALVAKRGIAVVEHRLCRSEDEAAAALKAIGAPVAVKGCSADVAHKSELGLVRLGLAEEGAVREAYRAMEDALRRHGARFDGVIVAAMAQGGRRELMIGAHRDPVFGPVVAVGDGGKYVEAMPDVRLLLPPFGPEEVGEALGSLRIAPLLAGVRGERPMDVAAFCGAAAAVGRLMLEDAGIDSLDLNPVLLRDEGAGYAVVDAVVFRRGG